MPKVHSPPAIIVGSPLRSEVQDPSRSAWVGSLVVLTLLALPVALTSATIGIVINVTIWWQRMQGLRVMPPTPAAIVAMAFGFYAVALWISVFAAWRWSSRRGFAAEVFAFRHLTWMDAAVAVAGFLAALYAAPPITNWVSHLIGGGASGRSINPAMALVVVNSILTAPIGEEVLFRGLLVAWLRRLGWPIPAIWLAGSLAFASIHLVVYGVAWTTTMVCFGAMLYGVRFWRRSLTPCWLIHLLFNARGSVILPLVALLRHALATTGT